MSETRASPAVSDNGKEEEEEEEDARSLSMGEGSVFGFRPSMWTTYISLKYFVAVTGQTL